MIRRPSQRVAIFIDTQNMYHSAKHLYGARVNFPALVEAAVANRELVRAIAYVAKSKTGEENAFFDALTSNGIELKVKDVQEFASGEKKADWDVGMAVDAMAVAPRVDVVILVTGDGDFIPLVNYLKANGIVCEAVAFGSSTNTHFREAVDGFLDLSEDPSQFLLQSRQRMNHGHVPKTKKDLDSIFEAPDFDSLPPQSPSLAKLPSGRKSVRPSTLSNPSNDEETIAEEVPKNGRNIRVTF